MELMNKFPNPILVIAPGLMAVLLVSNMYLSKKCL